MENVKLLTYRGADFEPIEIKTNIPEPIHTFFSEIGEQFPNKNYIVTPICYEDNLSSLWIKIYKKEENENVLIGTVKYEVADGSNI